MGRFREWLDDLSERFGFVEELREKWDSASVIGKIQLVCIALSTGLPWLRRFLPYVIIIAVVTLIIRVIVVKRRMHQNPEEYYDQEDYEDEEGSQVRSLLKRYGPNQQEIAVIKKKGTEVAEKLHASAGPAALRTPVRAPNRGQSACVSQLPGDHAHVVGSQFEMDAYNFLCDYFGDGHIFHDVYLPIGENYTQCDIVVVHDSGIYVLECKDIVGAIYGREKSMNWKVFLRDKEYPLYNPILQNRTHCGAVADTCEVAPDSVVSIILFSLVSDVRCDELPHEGRAYHLANPENLADILDDLTEGDILFTSKEVQEIAKVLKSFTNPPDSIRRAHLDYVQSLKERSNG